MAVERDDTEDSGSIRDSLEAAFDKDAETQAGGGATHEEPAQEPTEEPVEEPTEEPGEEPGDKKLKPDDKGEKPLAAKDVSPKEHGDIGIKMPKSRAPGTWTPVAREKWAALPAEVQREILKRERDIATGFNEVTEIKKFRDNFGGLMNQHQNIINAEGGDGMKMTRDLFQTAAVLYNGSPQQKVQTVAAMIKNFGIDLQLLDTHLAQVLSGQPSPAQHGGNTGNQSDIAAYIKQQIEQAIAPFAGQSDARVTQEAETDVNAFADDPKNEFFEDVKDTMADLLEVSSKRGIKMDLQTAYKRATMMHPEIADIIADRQLREKAQQRNGPAAAARKRAVSVTGAPSRDLAGGTQRGDSLRSDLEAAIEANSD